MKGIHPMVVIVLLIGSLIVVFWAANTGLVISGIEGDIVSLNVNVTGLPATNVSNANGGTFGANTGGGNYSFPNNLTIQETLQVDGFNTGNVLLNEIDATFGTVMGAIGIGPSQIFVSDIVIASLNISDSLVFRNTPNGNPLEFLFATSDNLIRFAIPTSGKDLAVYNPRSMMVGGDLGQAFDNNMINCTAQGYNLIDCDTTLTGADLGIQNDLEVRGTIFGANVTGIDDTVMLISNSTTSNSYMSVNRSRQQFGSDIGEVQFLATRVNFTNLLGNNVLSFVPFNIDIAENLRLRNEDFEYQTGVGYQLITHNATVTGIDDTIPKLKLVEMTPTWEYTQPITTFPAFLNVLAFQPTLTPVGQSLGLDISNLAAAVFTPTFFDPIDSRTFLQIAGIVINPTVSGNASTVTIRGALIQPTVQDNASTTNAIGLTIQLAVEPNNGSVVTYSGLVFTDTPLATNNRAIVSDSSSLISFHDGNFGLGGCHLPDHDLSIGGTGAGCNTGTWSEIDAGQATFTVSSSSDIKENFSPVTPTNILDKVSNVGVFTYDFKAYNYTEVIYNESNGQFYNLTVESPQIPDRMGFKAEDFNTIFGRGDGTSLSGDEIMYALWLSVQELIEENELLKERVSVLESK